MSFCQSRLEGTIVNYIVVSLADIYWEHSLKYPKINSHDKTYLKSAYMKSSKIIMSQKEAKNDTNNDFFIQLDPKVW